jgi:hypothetical protein
LRICLTAAFGNAVRRAYGLVIGSGRPEFESFSVMPSNDNSIREPAVGLNYRLTPENGVLLLTGDSLSNKREAEMIKRLSVFWVALFLGFFVLTYNIAYDSAGDGEFICGDTNGDTSVDILDITYLINSLYQSGPPVGQPEAADVNLDGKINILDILYLISYLYKGGQQLCPTPELPAYQKYLFEVEYFNAAWWYGLNGFYIDSSGYVYQYNHSDEVWDTAAPPLLTEADLTAKYSHGNVLIGFVDPDSLLAKFLMVESAGQGPFFGPVTVCFDFGGIRYMAYQLDTVTWGYNTVLLRQTGDVCIKNLSPAAQDLIEWLDSINDAYANPYCNCPDK